MLIYLKHPTHGTKIATLEAEAEFDEKNGWVRYTLDEVKTDPEGTKSKRGPRKKVAEDAPVDAVDDLPTPDFLAPLTDE